MGNCLNPRTAEDVFVPESPVRFGGRRRWARSPERRPRRRESHQARAAPLTLEEQVRVAQRLSQIQRLPAGVYGSDGLGEDTQQECAICSMDFVCGDRTRSLPCKHVYHLDCIDEWLMRSCTCPYCRRPPEVPPPPTQGKN
ncbi:RING finger protein 11-like [Camelus dromedarius]|uniref:RING finger protein 11-like n=2 Tax=Camelus TaxID=9836 RepID=S9Y4D6_CAMFR|nr:RING finger protein 11-like [Camelus ferus]XP_045367201.1 RING finger protein 11-like [Camelus bactrianus]EPY78825.1 RING finger protein 11 [Camelus ferus]